MFKKGDYVYSTTYDVLAEVIAVIEDRDSLVLEFENGDMEVVQDNTCALIEIPSLFEVLDEYCVSGSKCLELYQKVVHGDIRLTHPRVTPGDLCD